MVSPCDKKFSHFFVYLNGKKVVNFCCLIINEMKFFSRICRANLFPLRFWLLHMVVVCSGGGQLAEGDFGLRSSCASLWRLSRRKRTFYHCTMQHVDWQWPVLAMHSFFQKIGMLIFLSLTYKSFFFTHLKLLNLSLKFWLLFSQNWVHDLKNVQRFTFFYVK